MANRIVDLIYGILLNIPLIISLPYLIKIIIDSKKNDTIVKFLTKLFASVLLAVVAFFIVFIILSTFIFIKLEIPEFFKVMGFILFALYYLTFGGFLYGIGLLGHGGISPIRILQELIRELKNSK